MSFGCRATGRQEASPAAGDRCFVGCCLSLRRRCLFCLGSSLPAARVTALPDGGGCGVGQGAPRRGAPDAPDARAALDAPAAPAAPAAPDGRGVERLRRIGSSLRGAPGARHVRRGRLRPVRRGFPCDGDGFGGHRSGCRIVAAHRRGGVPQRWGAPHVGRRLRGQAGRLRQQLLRKRSAPWRQPLREQPRRLLP